MRAKITEQSRGAYRENHGNQNQGSRGGLNNSQNNGYSSNNIYKYCKQPGRSIENCWKLQAKKTAINPVNNENEYHEDHNDQSREEDPTVTSVFKAQSH
jgi:hypothetical protein